MKKHFWLYDVAARVVGGAAFVDYAKRVEFQLSMLIYCCLVDCTPSYLNTVIMGCSGLPIAFSMLSSLRCEGTSCPQSSFSFLATDFAPKGSTTALQILGTSLCSKLR